MAVSLPGWIASVVVIVFAFASLSTPIGVLQVFDLLNMPKDMRSIQLWMFGLSPLPCAVAGFGLLKRQRWSRFAWPISALLFVGIYEYLALHLVFGTMFMFSREPVSSLVEWGCTLVLVFTLLCIAWIGAWLIASSEARAWFDNR